MPSKRKKDTFFPKDIVEKLQMNQEQVIHDTNLSKRSGVKAKVDVYFHTTYICDLQRGAEIQLPVCLTGQDRIFQGTETHVLPIHIQNTSWV